VCDLKNIDKCLLPPGLLFLPLFPSSSSFFFFFFFSFSTLSPVSCTILPAGAGSVISTGSREECRERHFVLLGCGVSLPLLLLFFFFFFLPSSEKPGTEAKQGRGFLFFFHWPTRLESVWVPPFPFFFFLPLPLLFFLAMPHIGQSGLDRWADQASSFLSSFFFFSRLPPTE